MAGKYKRHFGRAEREQRKQLRNEADSLIKDARRVEEQIVSGLLNNAQAIVTTLVGAVNHFLRERTFSTIIIDEAAQALEPATWIPISKADRVIFAGDPFQLPPTVKSREAELGGLSKTLVEKQLDLGRPVNLLDRQYRMNKLIMGFSNEWFYEGKLVADETVSDWTLMSVAGPIHPMEFVDTAGLNYEESQDQESMSFENPDEFRLIRTHLLRLAGELSDEEEPTVGIISPYRQQVRYMKEAVAKDALLSEIPNLVVNTIDSFQGQERDIIYISLVRSNSRNEIGFLSDYRRMNVAMTRAKKKLVMIGDSATLGGHEFYDKLLEYCDKTGSYRSAWELVTE